MLRANLRLVVTTTTLTFAGLLVKAALREDQEEDARHRIRVLELRCRSASLEAQYRQARRKGDLDTTDALTHAWGVRNRADRMAADARTALLNGQVDGALEVIRQFEQDMRT